MLGKVESGTHVRVMRLDSIYGNVQVMAPNGMTGLISIGDVILRTPNWTEWSKTLRLDRNGRDFVRGELSIPSFRYNVTNANPASRRS